jgi:hypothetical protein
MDGRNGRAFRQARSGCGSTTDELPLWNESSLAYQRKPIAICLLGMLARPVLPIQGLAAKMKMAAAQVIPGLRHWRNGIAVARLWTKYSVVSFACKGSVQQHDARRFESCA